MFGFMNFIEDYAVFEALLGSVRDGSTVRDLLVSVAGPRIRAAAKALDEAETAMTTRDDEPAQMAYAHALTDWAEAHGYEAETGWDVCTVAALGVRGGSVTSLRAAVGGAWRDRPGVTDLGRVPAAEAARYLIALARQSGGDVGGKAVFAATLADSVTTWPDLLRLARDPDVPGGTRRSAVFWVSQAAEAAATRGLDSLAGDGRVDREVREQAVFALSQRPKDEGVPALIRIATTHSDPEIRRRAIFWLGQSNDPRALELFETLLTRP
jgi:hypothetical protein